MKKFAWTLLVSISFCFLSACGGGGGGSASSTGTGTSPTPPATPTVFVGEFLDSAVANIKYKTATQSGTTSALGKFNYLAGETVTFSVGSVTLPTTLAAATITPMNLANTTDMGNNTVLNLLVFLQSLDEDGTPGNGIKIPDAANAAATAVIDFTVSPTVFRDNSVFTTLVKSSSGSATKTPVTTAVALAHFVDTLDAKKIVVQDPRPTAKIAQVAQTPVGKTVTLNGSESTDPKSVVLSYNWTLSVPSGSYAKLSKSTDASPTFSIDISGDYLVTLVVNNGTLSNTTNLTVSGIDNVFGSSNLYLYGKDSSNDSDLVYIGCLTCDSSQPESICSSDPASSYGFAPSASSIWDTNFEFGDPASKYSPWDYPGFEKKSPTIATSKGGYLRAFFSIDKSMRDLHSKIDIGDETRDPRVIDYLETLFAAPNAGPIDVLTALCGAGASPNNSISAIQAVKKKQR
jgi:hypothetical protein